MFRKTATTVAILLLGALPALAGGMNEPTQEPGPVVGVDPPDPAEGAGGTAAQTRSTLRDRGGREAPLRTARPRATPRLPASPAAQPMPGDGQGR